MSAETPAPDDLLQRVRAEFIEMPGLRVTRAASG